MSCADHVVLRTFLILLVLVAFYNLAKERALLGTR